MLKSKRTQWETALVKKAEAYLRETFGTAPHLEQARLPHLPFFVKDQYAIWTADILGRACLFMAPTPESDASVEEMARHVDLVKGKSEMRLVVLLFDTVTSARRSALLSRRMAFMAPMAQLFVPEAVLDMRERAPRHSPREVETYSPTAQVAILGALLRPDWAPASATVLARTYGVAIMSMTRAFDELAATGLAETERRGQRRVLEFHKRGRDLWDAAAPRLQSPVRKIRAVVIPWPDRFPGKLAGESALSVYTSLAASRRQRLAVASSQWNQIVRDEGVRETEAAGSDSDDVETWAYNPSALAKGDVVDRLSLYLSIRDHLDERVAIAAEELLEGMSWS